MDGFTCGREIANDFLGVFGLDEFFDFLAGDGVALPFGEFEKTVFGKGKGGLLCARNFLSGRVRSS